VFVPIDDVTPCGTGIVVTKSGGGGGSLLWVRDWGDAAGYVPSSCDFQCNSVRLPAKLCMPSAIEATHTVLLSKGKGVFKQVPRELTVLIAKLVWVTRYTNFFLSPPFCSG
jgi:hypothetical protein